jgi:hypothetical protein
MELFRRRAQLPIKLVLDIDVKIAGVLVVGFARQCALNSLSLLDRDGIVHIEHRLFPGDTKSALTKYVDGIKPRKLGPTYQWVYLEWGPVEKRIGLWQWVKRISNQEIKAWM